MNPLAYWITRSQKSGIKETWLSRNCYLGLALFVSPSHLKSRFSCRRPRNPFKGANQLSVCMKFPAYLRRTTQLCQNNKNALLGVVLLNGTQMAIRECQKQFSARRWNCSHNTKSIEAIVSYGMYASVKNLWVSQRSQGLWHARCEGQALLLAYYIILLERLEILVSSVTKCLTDALPKSQIP